EYGRRRPLSSADSPATRHVGGGGPVRDAAGLRSARARSAVPASLPRAALRGGRTRRRRGEELLRGGGGAGVEAARVRHRGGGGPVPRGPGPAAGHDRRAAAPWP